MNARIFPSAGWGLIVLTTMALAACGAREGELKVYGAEPTARGRSTRLSGDDANARDDEPTIRDLVRKYVRRQELAAVSGTSKTTGPKKNEVPDKLPGDLRKVIALEYTVLLRKSNDGDEKAEEEPIDPHDHEFKLGDKIRVQVEPLSDLYIYIFHEGASGERTCLLPSDEETPPLAKGERKLRLPSDGGYFEFMPPAGEERLIVVATEEKVDRSVLASLVFKKPDEKLSTEEQAIQQKLKARAQKTLKSIREQRAQGTKFRGLFTDEVLAEVAGELKDEGGTRAVLEEPPHGAQTSTFTMSVSPDKDGAGELFVSIPLKSTSGDER